MIPHYCEEANVNILNIIVKFLPPRDTLSVKKCNKYYYANVKFYSALINSDEHDVDSETIRVLVVNAMATNAAISNFTKVKSLRINYNISINDFNHMPNPIVLHALNFFNLVKLFKSSILMQLMFNSSILTQLRIESGEILAAIDALSTRNLVR